MPFSYSRTRYPLSKNNARLSGGQFQIFFWIPKLVSKTHVAFVLASRSVEFEGLYILIRNTNIRIRRMAHYICTHLFQRYRPNGLRKKTNWPPLADNNSQFSLVWIELQLRHGKFSIEQITTRDKMLRCELVLSVGRNVRIFLLNQSSNSQINILIFQVLFSDFKVISIRINTKKVYDLPSDWRKTALFTCITSVNTTKIASGVFCVAWPCRWLIMCCSAGGSGHS